MITKTAETFQFDTIDDVVSDIAKGRIVIVTDDADRENEGDLVMAAEKVTPEAINFMATHGRAATGWSTLRDSARRRHNGTIAGADGVPPEAWPAHLHHPKFDRASPPP